MSNHPVDPVNPQGDPVRPGELGRPLTEADVPTTDIPTSDTPPPTITPRDPGPAADPAPDTKSVAKDEAGALAGQAKAEGQRVAGEAKAQAGEVAAEAKHQIRSLTGQARHALADTAGQQQQRAGSGLRTLSDEFAALASGNPQSGMAADLVQNAAGRLSEAAQWLERDSQTVINDVRRYARRNPVTFLAICAGAGLLAGRLTRSLKDAPDTGSTSGRHVADGLPASANPTNTPGYGGPSPVEQGVLATPSGTLPPATTGQPSTLPPGAAQTPSTQPVTPQPDYGTGNLQPGRE